MKIFFSYIGKFSALAGALGVIYAVVVFFTNLRNDIDTVITNQDKIQIGQYQQGNQLKNIDSNIKCIIREQDNQNNIIEALDKSLINHYRQDKKNIDELIKYFELKDEKKK